MSGNEFLDRLERGVEFWNGWRATAPDVTPDLSGVYLFEADLRGANLQGVDFSRACLIGANLQQANLQQACLNGAYATAANFSNANLQGADLRGVNVSEANLQNANLSNVQAASANFTAARLTGACIEGWLIDSTTQITDVVCSYVYRRSPQHDPYPAQGQLQPGEFVHLLLHDPSRLQPSPPASATPGLHAVSTDDVAPPEQSHTAPQSFHAQPPGIEPSAPVRPEPVRQPLLTRRVSQPAAHRFAANPTELWRSPPWRIGAGIAAAVILLGAIALLGRSLFQPNAIPTVAALPCREPRPPALPERPADHVYSNGTQYYGLFANGVPVDGRGIMVFDSGNRYDGEYRNGERQGCGTFTFANGRRYVGQFERDQFSGQGEWILENGDRYIGEFAANKCHGEGTFIFANGSSETGMWRDGNLVDGNLSCDRRSPASPDSPN